jgi:uncharacterized repeat protein (TIGR03809 family)
MPAAVTRKWRALAEKRRDHLIALYKSGRWKLYYTEEQLLGLMRETVRLIKTWDQLALPQVAARTAAAK